MTSLRPSRATAKLCVWTLLCMCALPTWRPCTCTWKIFKRPRRGLKKASTRQLRAVPFTVFHQTVYCWGTLFGKKGWPHWLTAPLNFVSRLRVQCPGCVSGLCPGLVLLLSPGRTGQPCVLLLSCCCPLAVLANLVSSSCPPLVLLLSSGRAGQLCILFLSFIFLSSVVLMSSCPGALHAALRGREQQVLPTNLVGV